jgi:ABC-2 type transport system permease protein
MNARILLAVAARVLNQLRRDHRTAAMLLLVPSLILALLWWMFDDRPIGGMGFDALGPPLLALIPFIVMFLVTSVTTLRERSSGTLERLLAMPTAKIDFLGGYALAFGAVAAVQAVAATAFATLVCGLDTAGPASLLVVVAIVDAWLGMALGLLASAFARTEFQAVQFMPAVVLPQFLLCGLLLPRDQLPDALHAVSTVLPLSYAVDAMVHIAGDGALSAGFVADVLVVAGCSLVALAAGAATLRRRTP